MVGFDSPTALHKRTCIFSGENEVLDDASDVVESDGEDQEDGDDLFEYMQDVEDDQDLRGSNNHYEWGVGEII